MWIPFSNWQPDLDPITPGMLYGGEELGESSNFLPTRRGYRNSQSLYPVSGQTTLTTNPTGLYYAIRTDGSANFYAAAGTQMYVRVGTSWTVALNVLVTMSAVATRLQFTQYGDLTFAGAKETQPMITDTLTFTSIAAMPRFAVIGQASEFIMLGNVAVSVTYSDGFGTNVVSPGDYPDRWWCSGVGNPLTYQPTGGTQAASGRLTDLPGPLTAGAGLNDQFVFYKQKGIWLGTYVGNPFVWTWAMVSREIGCNGPQNIVVVDNVHYFIGNDDFYSFDGQQIRPIGAGVREWFFRRASRQYLYKALGWVDRNEKIVYWGFVPATSTTGNIAEFICFHYENGRWGRSESFASNVVAEAYADQVTYDQLWTGLTFDAAPNTDFDHIVNQFKTVVPTFLNFSGELDTLFNGVPQNSQLVTTFGGDDTKTSLLRRIRMRWIVEPTFATLTPYRLMRQGQTPTGGITRTMTNARFDFTQVARWHKAKINTVASHWETTGVDAEIVVRGRE